jgi:thioredoxin-like negative regulator of GroEL
MIYFYNSDTKSQIEPLFQKGIVLLSFSAPWCGTCRAVKRTISEFDRKGLAPVVEIDVDREKEMGKRFSVQGVPALMLIKDGRIVDRIAGSLDYEEFKAWIAKNDYWQGLI